MVRKGILPFLVVLLSLSLAMTATAAVRAVKPIPFEKVVKANVGVPSPDGKIIVPLITWPGDEKVVAAKVAGIFKKHQLDVELVLDNDPQSQVEKVISGERWLLRMTMGMQKAVAVSLEDARVAVELGHQLTYSTGGDVIIALEHIQSTKDLCKATIGMQWGGPHPEFVFHVLHTACDGDLSGVTIVWFRDLFPPAKATDDLSDAVSAMAEGTQFNGKKLDAVAVIYPDAVQLTSHRGDKEPDVLTKSDIGDGAEGNSVSGAHMITSTAEASNITADTFWARTDFAKSHPDTYLRFKKAMLEAEEWFRDLRKAKASQVDTWKTVMEESGALLFGSRHMSHVAEGALADCTFMDTVANFKFLAGVGTTRTALKLSEEIERSFLAQKVISRAPKPIVITQWDWKSLAEGLKYVDLKELEAGLKGDVVAVTKPQFDAGASQKQFENMLESDAAFDPSLFLKEVQFKAGKKEFDPSEYDPLLRAVINTRQAYAGTQVFVEGHASDEIPRKLERQGRSAQAEHIRGRLKDLSLSRAKALVERIKYLCGKEKIGCDESAYVPIGMGPRKLKHPHPTSVEINAENRRAVFNFQTLEADQAVQVKQ